MQRHPVRRVVVGLILIIVLVADGEAAVDLPFEWFHGRWVRGHTIFTGFEWQHGSEPAFGADYLFHTERHELGLAEIDGNLFWEDESGVVSPPVPFWRYRPSDHWQVAIDGVTYTEENTSYVPSGFTGVVSEESKDLRIDVSTVWQNQSTMALDVPEAAYNYAVGPLFARSFTIAAIEASLANSSAGSFWLTPGDVNRQNEISLDYSDWRIRSTLGTHKLDGLQTSFVFALAGRNMTSVTDAAVTSPDQNWDYYLVCDRRKTSTLSAFYEIEALVTAVAPIYLVADWRLQVDETDSTVARTVYVDTTQSDLYTEGWDGELDNRGRRISLSLHWLAAGDFVPSLLRDDYGTDRQLSVLTTTGCNTVRSGFYRGLFPAGMQLLTLNYSHDSYAPPGYENSETEELSLLWRRGFGGRLETQFRSRRWRPIPSRFDRAAGSAATYWYFDFGVRWRSYEYDPDSGPGWYRDSDVEVALGSRLAAGQWYGAVTFAPPSLEQHGFDIGVLDFSDLENSHSSDLSIMVDIGLGRTIELHLSHYESYRHSSINFRSTSASLSARLFRRADVAIEYRQRYSHPRFSGGRVIFQSDDGWSDPSVSLEVRALL